MCGIAGFIKYKNGYELAKMANEVQYHRGPDNQSVWNDDYIALAHQRLSIIDLKERSNQPFVKYDYVIVFNGEIYNYKNLKNKYLNKVIFKTTSDTEVVLELYKKFKENCVKYLIGMFAFTIYDKKNKDIFCARDHFGIKPFYYYQNNNKFAFASELKTLVKIPGFNKSINKKSLIKSLNYLWIPGNETIFSNVFKIPPGHYLKLNSENKIFLQKYWEVNTETKDFMEDDLIKKLDSEFTETMKRHMVSDVPISSFLSGGLDSSLISVAAKKNNSNISTYTIGLEDKDKKIEKMPDDQKYARMVAGINNFNHNEIIINSKITENLPNIIRSLDEPIGDPAAINTFLICKSAREKGVKVLLSGMGADEIFFGYRRHKATIFSQKFSSLPKIFIYLIKFLVKILPVRISSRGFRLFRWAKKFIFLTSNKIEESYRKSYSYYDKNELISLFRNKNGIEEIIDEIYSEHDKIFNSKYIDDKINKMCYTDINMFMTGLNLSYTDKASMAASVEVRVPFIDRDFIDFSMSIKGNFKFKKSISKYILKKVAEKYLQKEIIYRPKASFGAPIRSWISGDLKKLVEDCLSRKSIEKRKIFNYSTVKKIIRNDKLGIDDNAYKIYQLLTIELWFREFIDKN